MLALCGTAALPDIVTESALGKNGWHQIATKYDNNNDGFYELVVLQTDTDGDGAFEFYEQQLHTPDGSYEMRRVQYTVGDQTRMTIDATKTVDPGTGMAYTLQRKLFQDLFPDGMIRYQNEILEDGGEVITNKTTIILRNSEGITETVVYGIEDGVLLDEYKGKSQKRMDQWERNMIWRYKLKARWELRRNNSYEYIKRSTRRLQRNLQKLWDKWNAGLQK
jgi:hypothetical protein